LLLSKGYLHCEVLSRSLYRLFSLPARSVGCSNSGTPAKRLSVKKKNTIHTLYKEMVIIFCFVLVRRFEAFIIVFTEGIGDVIRL
jgi:hypothetical protein